MKRSELVTGVLYSKKGGYEPMVVLDSENTFTPPQGYRGRTAAPGGKHIAVLRHHGDALPSSRPDLVEAAKSVKLDLNEAGRLDVAEVQTPAGTRLAFVTPAQIAGTHEDETAKREAERHEIARSNRRAAEAAEARNAKAKEVSEAVNELTGGYMSSYANNVGLISISLTTLEKLVALAQQAPKSAE